MEIAAFPRRFCVQVYRASQPVRGWATAGALVGIFTVLALAIRVFCRDSHGWSPFWPANGAIVVALLVLPRRLGAFVLVIDGLINLAVNASAGYGPVAQISDSVENCGVGLLLAVLIRNFCGAATDLSRFRRLATFMGLSVVAAGIEAAFGEVVDAIGGAPDVDIGGWFWWTLCDALGLIIATPAVLLCVKNKRYVKFSDASRAERILLFVLILALTLTAFSESRSNTFIFLYPLLLLMAFRAGPTWVLASVLTVSIVASAMTLHGLGPLFSLAADGGRLRQRILQKFLLSLFICAVPANNALGDMGRAAQRLRRVHASARQARASAVAANLAKSQFVANVSHEIRTPLNGVLGMAQILAGGELSAVQRQRVDIIRNSGQMLLGILNDVLDFSKMEAGKLDLEATPFDLAKIAQDVQAAFSAVALQKNVRLVLRLETTADRDASRLRIGDPTRVRQIISNLVSNALKFTQVGEVQITVADHGDGVAISVRDTGIGIPEDKLPKLFAQFAQVDSSTTRRFGGTGLGLSICQDLCSLMGGQIVVESEFGNGSTFTVLLPLPVFSEPEASAAPLPSPEAVEPAAPDGGPRVLAAEDNKINQLVLTTLLQHMGVAPMMVEDGAKAVQAWREGQFDLVLMDMQMPVMDGLTAVRAIRAAEAASARPRTRIVALTADVLSHHLEDYRQAGVDAVVSKPIQFDELEQTINALLDPPIEATEPALLTV